jgi:iron complex transport system substrate-binding protein
VSGEDPEVIIGSWCGRAVKREWIRKRDGWEQISAIRNDYIYEVKSAYILQPGPAALTEGLRQLHAILAHAVNQQIEQVLLPKEKTDAALGLPPPDKPVAHAAV